MVVDNSLTDSLYNSNRVARRRDADDDEGAHRRQLRRDQVHDGQRLLGRLDPAEHGRRRSIPGLLDGIQPSCDFPDSITTGIEVTDCVLLVNVYVEPGVDGADDRPDAGADQRQEDRDQRPPRPDRLPVWNNSFGFNNKPGNYVPTLVVNQTTGAIAPVGAPRNNCLLPAALVYDPVTNPNGTRCGDPDLAAAVWGTTAGIAAGQHARPADRRQRRRPVRPEGAALRRDHARGVRHAEREDRRHRRRLEPHRGALASPTARRSTSPTAPASSRAARTSASCRSSIRAATTSRASTTSGAASAERARIDAANGGNHGNQVMWRYGTGLLPATAAQVAAVTLKSFLTMDTWLSNLTDERAEGDAQRRCARRRR